MRIWTLVLLCIVVLSACAPSRYVKPLEKGQKAVSVNLGGPLIHFAGATIPIPLSATNVGFGVTDDLTLHGGIHLTSLAFGVIQGEIGVVKEFVSPDSLSLFKPGFSVSHTSNFAVDVWDGNFKFWPQLDANLYWHMNNERTHYAYLGVNNWFELSSRRAHGEEQNVHWLFSPQLGFVFNKPNWQYGLEGKWLAPNQSNQNLVVDYAKPFGSNGALGIYVTISKKF